MDDLIISQGVNESGFDIGDWVEWEDTQGVRRIGFIKYFVDDFKRAVVKTIEPYLDNVPLDCVKPLVIGTRA